MDPKPLIHAAISLARPYAGWVGVWDLVVPGKRGLSRLGLFLQVISRSLPFGWLRVGDRLRRQPSVLDTLREYSQSVRPWLM